MCNPECVRFVSRVVTPADAKGKSVIEVGSYNVNGGVRGYIESLEPESYVGIDINEGPGVDRVMDASHLVGEFGAESFDLVVSTEMLEHVVDWQLVINNLKLLVRPGGLIVVTTRSRGFPLHGYPYDHWRFQPEDMRVVFADCDDVEVVSDNPTDPGVFVAARRPTSPDWSPLDLSGYAMWSIHSDTRVLEAEYEAPGQTVPVEEFETLETRNREVEKKSRELRSERDRLRQQVKDLRSSRTFRYTKFLRK